MHISFEPMILQILLYLLLAHCCSAQISPQQAISVSSSKELAVALSTYRIQNIEVTGELSFQLPYDSQSPSHTLFSFATAIYSRVLLTALLSLARDYLSDANNMEADWRDCHNSRQKCSDCSR